MLIASSAATAATQGRVRHARLQDGVDQLVGQARRVGRQCGVHPGLETARARAAIGVMPLTIRVRCPRAPTVPAVGGQVLGDEDDLAQRALVLCAGASSASTSASTSSARSGIAACRGRHGAEPANAITPLGDFDVGPGRGAVGRGSSRRSKAWTGMRWR